MNISPEARTAAAYLFPGTDEHGDARDPEYLRAQLVIQDVIEHSTKLRWRDRFWRWLFHRELLREIEWDNHRLQQKLERAEMEERCYRKAYVGNLDSLHEARMLIRELKRRLSIAQREQNRRGITQLP